MFEKVCPKLPMRDKAATRVFYIDKLRFQDAGVVDYPDYLMVRRDEIELHFFLFKEIDPKENYGQIYIRTNNIDEIYQTFIADNIEIHPNGKLGSRPWGQKEFSILDPDNNLITFGQAA